VFPFFLCIIFLNLIKQDTAQNIMKLRTSIKQGEECQRPRSHPQKELDTEEENEVWGGGMSERLNL